MAEDDFAIELTRDQALALSEWLSRVIGTAVFDGVVPHGLPHTATSPAVNAGANVKVVQKTLAHKTAR